MLNKAHSFYENAVIVGTGFNALGVLRALDKKIPKILVTEKSTVISKSHLAKKHYVKSTIDKSIIKDLILLGQSLPDKSVLFLTEETTVELVSRHRSELTEYFHLNMVNDHLVNQLLSKSGFYDLALQHNALVPKSVVLDSEQRLKKIDTLTFPCVYKPLYRDEQYASRFKKAYKVETKEDLLDLYKAISPVFADMILQEWIDGTDEDIYFCIAYFDQNSKVVNSFTGRKIICWPPNVGGTASCTSAPEHHDELLAATQDFAAKIGYQGLIGMEFKYDKTRQGFYMIEPTVVRTDYQHEIAALSGFKILDSIYYHLSNNESVSNNEVKSNIVWIDEISSAKAKTLLGTIMYPKRSIKYKVLARLSDPLPFIFYCIESCKVKLKTFRHS